MCRIIDHEPIEDIDADEAYIPENFRNDEKQVQNFENLADKPAPWTIFSTTPTTTTPLPNYEQNLANLPWIILGFSDFSYSKIAKIWYYQLEKLGYTEHRIVPLDEKTEKFFQNENSSIKLAKPRELLNNTHTIHQIWTSRIQTINDYLFKGYNVFVTDVDSIWVNYRNLSHLPTSQFSTFHAEGLTFPMDTYKVWNFTVCGGIAGYSPSRAGLRFINILSKACTDCDDQRTMNWLYTHRYKMKWYNIPGFKGRVGDSSNSNEDDLKSMKSMVFDKSVVVREKVDCRKNKEDLWIVSPGAMKEESKKIFMLKDHTGDFEKIQKNMDFPRYIFYIS